MTASPPPRAHIEVLAGAVWRLVRDGLRHSPLAPTLQALRSGSGLRGGLRDGLRSLLEDLLGDPAAGPMSATTIPTPGEWDDTGSLDPDAAPPEVVQISEAIAEGIRRAVRTGELRTQESADVLGWAITSLMMTLVMRSRDGEDPGALVAAGTQALEELLADPDGHGRGPAPDR